MGQHCLLHWLDSTNTHNIVVIWLLIHQWEKEALLSYKHNEQLKQVCWASLLNKLVFHLCCCFPAPPPPYNLTAYNDSSTAITLNWARPLFPNGLIQFYVVVYYPEGNISGAINTTTPNTTLTINGLAFYTLYFFNVSVVTGGGTSPFAGPISQRTSEDGTFLDVHVMMKVTVSVHPSPLPSPECDGIQHQLHLHHGYLATTTDHQWHHQRLSSELLCFRRVYWNHGHK